MTAMTNEVIVLPALADNFIYALTAPEGLLAVDPSEAEPVQRLLDERELPLLGIVLTHYHGDHTGGVEALRRRYRQAWVAGPRGAAGLRIDRMVEEGDVLAAGPWRLEAIDTPGHAMPHVSYVERRRGWLFSGDCLFGAGCGRLASPAAASAMWQSLEKLVRLPDETRIYFGHAYTLENLAFAAQVEPSNTAIAKRRRDIAARLAAGQSCAPSTLAEEKATNPFLRVREAEVRAFVQADGKMPDAEVFAALRFRKDHARM